MEIKRFIIGMGCWLALSGNISAQSDVVITAVGERVVERGYRMPINPKVIDTTVKVVNVDYPLLNIRMETETELERINPASVKTKENLAQLYNSYIKLGIGTELMPLGEFYYNSDRSRKYVYGAHIKHLSSFGNIEGYAPSTFDRTRGMIYGGINESKFDLLGQVNYSNQGLHYYAIPTDSIIRDSIAQRYSEFGFSAQYKAHVKDSAKLNYGFGAAYTNFMSKKPLQDALVDWRARENNIAVTGALWYKLNKEVYALDIAVRHNAYRYGIADSSLSALDTGIVLNNTIVSFKPSITTRLKDNRFKAKIGVDLTLDAHTKTRFYIYPMAELKYSMFNDIFIPYLGLRGGLTQVSFRELTTRNEFVLPNQQLQNESTSFDLYGGIKGTLSRRMHFIAGISFANVKNQALFVNDSTFTAGNAFTVIYDTITMRTTIEGSLSYQAMEKLKIDGIARYYSYSLLNNSYAWNLPQLQFLIRGTYNLFDKFLIGVDLNMEQGRKALLYGPVEGSFMENGQHIMELGFIADANLSLEYRYNKRISAFFQMNNFAAQRYKRWYNAPVHGFQVMGGVTFRF
jgi:hypothetical protein